MDALIVCICVCVHVCVCVCVCVRMGRGQAGTLFKLVERLTFEKYSDLAYLTQFLLMYRLFASALQVR
jgi:hypothetical protein